MPTPPDQLLSPQEMDEQIQAFIDDIRNDPEYANNPEKKALIDAMAEKLKEAGGDSTLILEILTAVRERLEALNQEGDENPDKNLEPNPPGNPPDGPNENIDILSTVTDQYKSCLATLDYYHIPRKIKGIDEEEYDVPTLKQIQQRLSSQPEKLALIQKLHSPRMLLRPIALSTKTLSDALGNERNNNQKKVNPYNGVSIWNETLKDKQGNIVYSPTTYTQPEEKPDGSVVRTDGGKTKLELLQNNQTSFPGWDVVFIDGDTEVPEQSTHKDAHTLLKEFTAAGYSGMTVEDTLLLQMDGLKKGTLYNQKKVEYLLGNYVPGSSGVPYSYWSADDARMRVGNGGPDGAVPLFGARRLVRI